MISIDLEALSNFTPAVATAEILGKLVLSQGLATSFRPKKYYTIPREFLESSLEDVEQLINFFVIESQRILFAENIMSTVAVCSCSRSVNFVKTDIECRHSLLPWSPTGSSKLCLSGAYPSSLSPPSFLPL